MAKNKHIEQRDPLPENFTSVEELREFWDTHSSADYEDLMEPVEIEIEISSDKIYCPIAKDVMLRVRKQAKQQGVSSETLVNLWLQEKSAQTA